MRRPARMRHRVSAGAAHLEILRRPAASPAALDDRQFLTASKRRSLLRKRTDRDVIPVRIPERELLGSGTRVCTRLLFEPGHESASTFQAPIEIIDAKKQEQSIAGRRIVRTRQRRMFMRAPLVKAEQDSSIRIEDLTPIRMGRLRLGLSEERLIPLEADRHIADANDRPSAFHEISPASPASE